MIGFIGLFLLGAIVLGLFLGFTGKSDGIIAHMLLRGILLGLCSGVLSGTATAISYPLIEGTGQALDFWAIGVGVFGAILGGMFGTGIGALSGLVLGVVTHRFFVPLRNTTIYRWVMLTGGIISSVSLVIAVGWFLGGSSIQSYDMARRMSATNLYIVVPAIFAGILAIPSSLCLVRWHIGKSSRIASLPQYLSTRPQI